MLHNSFLMRGPGAKKGVWPRLVSIANASDWLLPTEVPGKDDDPAVQPLKERSGASLFGAYPGFRSRFEPNEEGRQLMLSSDSVCRGLASGQDIDLPGGPIALPTGRHVGARQEDALFGLPPLTS